MADKQKEADRQTMEAYTKVVEHCHGDKRFADHWFGQVNVELKSSPMNMIATGRTRELNQYIDQKMGRKK